MRDRSQADAPGRVVEAGIGEDETRARSVQTVDAQGLGAAKHPAPTANERTLGTLRASMTRFLLQTLVNGRLAESTDTIATAEGSIRLTDIRYLGDLRESVEGETGSVVVPQAVVLDFSVLLPNRR